MHGQMGELYHQVDSVCMWSSSIHVCVYIGKEEKVIKHIIHVLNVTSMNVSHTYIHV